MVRGAATVVAAQAAKSLDGIEEATGRVGAHAYGGLCELGTAFSGTPTEAAAAAREWYVEAGPTLAAWLAYLQEVGAPPSPPPPPEAQVCPPPPPLCRRRRLRRLRRRRARRRRVLRGVARGGGARRRRGVGAHR